MQKSRVEIAAERDGEETQARFPVVFDDMVAISWPCTFFLGLRVLSSSGP